ncbi:MAG TPA: very short patch repair endonuclease [Candidatus Aquilonibacter sp.]|nr:very short patch repair endonuclease [Candidatus Aquilonibacter sp.]
MADIFTKEKRSKIMASIKGKNTGIEIKLLKGMKKAGIRDFKYQKKMLGNPDFVFEKEKIAVFCDGNFWHGYRFSKWGNKLNKFWFDKITNNIKRDKRVGRKLKKEGWIVIRIREHQINKSTEKCVAKIQKIRYKT